MTAPINLKKSNYLKYSVVLCSATDLINSLKVFNSWTPFLFDFIELI